MSVLVARITAPDLPSSRLQQAIPEVSYVRGFITREIVYTLKQVQGDKLGDTETMHYKQV